MGCCWPTVPSKKESMQRNPNYFNHENRQLRNSILHTQRLELEYDSTCQQISSYTIDGKTIQKRMYNWHCVPIISQVPFENDRTEYQYTVKNVDVKDNNFLVGIGTLTAVSGNQKMPWKTDKVVCYQSHDKTQETGIVHSGSMSKKSRGVKSGQSITVSVSRKNVTFRIEDKKVGEMKLDSIFKDQIVPYICLFESGDRVQLDHKLKCKSNS